MFRIVVSILLGLFLVACSGHDEQYYALNPQYIEAALAACPNKSPGSITCEQLGVVAEKVNQLAYLLRTDQQAYGLSIIQLQNSIVEHESPSKRDALNKRLAVIQWLLSPGG